MWNIQGTIPWLVVHDDYEKEIFINCSKITHFYERGEYSTPYRKTYRKTFGSCIELDGGETVYCKEEPSAIKAVLLKEL